MALPAALVGPLLKALPMAIDGVCRGIASFVDKKDKRAKEEFEKNFSEFKKELQRDFTLLAESFESLQKKRHYATTSRLCP